MWMFSKTSATHSVCHLDIIIIIIIIIIILIIIIIII